MESWLAFSEADIPSQCSAFSDEALAIGAQFDSGAMSIAQAASGVGARLVRLMQSAEMSTRRIIRFILAN
jgi:hypothetical protein